MSRRIVIIGAIVAFAGLILVGGVAAYVLRTPAAPSGEQTAIPVLPTAVAQTTQREQQPEVTESSTLIVAELIQEESEARFIINEILNGNPKTVVGVTNDVAAQIVVDPADPSATQLGVVQVNARTLVTDSGNRNRAIQNQILDTAEFEFVTFAPTSFVNFPTTGAVGETFSFQIIGDLTIRDITREVTFNVTVRIESETRLSGLATATILRGDYNLVIPQVPQVAGVDEVVGLELEFVAVVQ